MKHMVAESKRIRIAAIEAMGKNDIYFYIYVLIIDSK